MNITYEQLREIALRVEQAGWSHIGPGLVGWLFAEFQKLQAEQVPLSDSYVQRVPNKCDRIIWRESYHMLPLDLAAKVAEIKADLIARCESIDRLDAERNELAAKVAELEATIRRIESERGQSQFCAECNQLATQNQAMREALKYAIDDLILRAKMNDDDALSIGQGCLDQMHEALALPDLATDILRKRDAETLRKSSDTFHCRAKAGAHDGVPLSEEAINACMYARIQLNEMAAELEKS